MPLLGLNQTSVDRIVVTNATALRLAWNQFGSIAHLCAAAVDFLQTHGAKKFDAALIASLERDCAAFALTIREYQLLLTTGGPSGSIPPMRDELAMLPPIVLKGPSFFDPILPPWRERQTTVLDQWMVEKGVGRNM
jgi:hypothetical protein